MKRLLLGALVVAFLAPAVPASAHAAYKASDPPDKGTVGAAPSSIWAEFTEPLADGSYLRVIDPCGRRVDAGTTEILGYRMSIGATGRTAGRYRVQYFALSNLDSHPVNGTFTFTATSGSSCDGGGGADPEPDPEQTDATEPGPGDGSNGGASAARGDAGEDGDVVASAPERRDRPGKDARPGKRKARAGDRAAERRGRGAQAPPPGAVSAAASIIEGIPWRWFLISLGLSALVGAAGGKIYADLVSPPGDD